MTFALAAAALASVPAETATRAAPPPTTRIAFTRGADFDTAILSFDPSGRTATRVLIRGSNADGSPSWSPDGRSLAFVSSRRGEPDLYVLRSDGRRVRPLVARRNSAESGPAWSPDGRRIAYSADSDLWVVNADGSGRRRLTQSPGRTEDADPTWSPDRTRIAFARVEVFGSELAVVSLGSRRVRRLTRTPWPEVAPAWSPDGRRIAFVSSRSRAPRLHTMRPDGSDERPFPLRGDLSSIATPAWSPDGRFLVFASGFEDAAELYVVRRDGAGLRRVTRNGVPDREPSWGRSPRPR